MKFYFRHMVRVGAKQQKTNLYFPPSLLVSYVVPVTSVCNCIQPTDSDNFQLLVATETGVISARINGSSAVMIGGLSSTESNGRLLLSGLIVIDNYFTKLEDFRKLPSLCFFLSV